MYPILGFQVSSITPYLDTPDHLHNSFQKLADIGYRDIQLQGVPAELPDSEIVAALRESGLRCIATQEDIPLGFGANPDRAISRAVACGSRYLTFAIIPQEVNSVDKLKEFAETICRINEKVKAAGLQFNYHPIEPDFRLMDGQPIFERLMSLLPQDIQLTFCVYAAHSAGFEPSSILKAYTGRIDLVHFKDSAPQPDGGNHLMPLG
ncbi:hypothetical protein J14TS2_34100 [Bacillus sp. J14TS2]|uniref:sugar phosphate isomerase/epimerase family protein n=1 Tax=Bacillus sp. J14TS2 TaxID=2807188 RepID=UPI001B2C1075|nr:TIM barrel protein [Bacillus sp. J14TS2]GIN72935.1 hypothetical protein J14TS2_34100 [Bacillus sp. J14TS2]